jgi:F-type H+-transporting ATPase subunit a
VAKKGCFGCSLPLIIGIVVILIVSFLGGPIGSRLVGDIGLPSIFSAARPEPKLPAEVIFRLGWFKITNSIIASWISIAVLVALFYAASRRAKLIPSRLQNMMEMVLEWLVNFCKEVAGEQNGRRFFPVVATIFLFVITNAWIGLLPGFGTITVTGADGEHVELLRAANTDINLPLALALASFILVGYFGAKLTGPGRFLKQYFNFGGFFRGLGQLFRGKPRAGMSMVFTGIIDIFVGMLELLSVLIRIVSFTFRLFGNMTAGEILIFMVIFLAAWVAPIPFYGLELLVGFIQALIFAGLTLVFLTVATATHESEG